MPDNRRKLLCACVVKASFFPLQFRILLSTLVLLTIASLLGQSNVQGPISIACKNQFVVIYIKKKARSYSCNNVANRFLICPGVSANRKHYTESVSKKRAKWQNTAQPLACVLR
uniref:(northern house mosquito) hypothetical protein n=1 Tax=Culex pipiens TaxID=7175 RepID=A0A8D8FZM0_CULPI